MKISSLPILRRFRSDERGAILVEFGLVMPLMILFFAITVESARMLWSYQTAINGVRDAARFLGRSTPSNICATSGSVAGSAAKLRNIVENDLAGNGVFPVNVTINSVTPSYTCVAGTYRVSPSPVAVVTANMTIDFPLSGIMTFFGSSMTSVTTNVTDRSRIFGQ